MDKSLWGVIVGGIFGFFGALLAGFFTFRIEYFKRRRDFLNSVKEKIFSRNITTTEIMHLYRMGRRRKFPKWWDYELCDFSNAQLPGVDLRFQRLNKIKFYQANLEGADFYEAVLDDADLARANLKGIELSRAKVRHAKIYKVNLENAKLVAADLSFSNLYKANMRNARLSGANLAACDLRGVDFTGANLEGVVLDGADLRGAVLDAVQLIGVRSAKQVVREAGNTCPP